MKTRKDEIKKMNKGKERPSMYNTFYNKGILSALNLLIENDDVWLSSVQLSEISGRPHKHVLRDIERDISSLYESLSYTNSEAYEIIHGQTDKRLPKFGLPSKLSLSTVIGEVNDIFESSENYDEFEKNILSNIKVLIKKRRTSGGTYDYYLLNRQASLMCLMRYSPVIRAYVADLFFKSVDMLKAKGHGIKSVNDMYMSIDEEINNSIETLESDLEEGEKLSQFNMWHLFWLLLNKIPPTLTKYFMKEFPSFSYMKEMAERNGDFTSKNFVDPDKKGNGVF